MSRLPGQIRRLVIHHSLTDDGPQSSVDAIRQYHIHHQGWVDIGYHLVVDRLGDAYETILGRPFEMVGAHAPGANGDSLGICLIGNFDRDPVPQTQLLHTVALVQWLMRFFDIPVHGVIGHREVTANRTCPGSHFDMEAFRNML